MFSTKYLQSVQEKLTKHKMTTIQLKSHLFHFSFLRTSHRNFLSHSHIFMLRYDNYYFLDGLHTFPTNIYRANHLSFASQYESIIIS